MGTDTTAPRRYFDADSHVLEPVDWLTPYADPDIRDRMRTLELPGAPTNESAAEIVAERSPTALDDDPLWGRGYRAFGAWDAGERTAILDKYGIDAQLVFSTFAPGPVPLQRPRPALRRCARPHASPGRLLLGDPRLLPGAAHPVRRHRPRPRGARRGARARAAAPCSSTPPRRRGRWARATRRLDPFWARLQDADVPFVSHIGTGGRLVPTGYRENGRPRAARLPRRRRERPLEGLHQHRLLAGELPLRPRPRRRVRAVPAPAGRVDRAGGRVGARRCSRSSTGPCSSPRTEPDLAALPDEGQRLHPPAGEVHALRQGRRRLDPRPGRSRSPPVLHRLPPPGGHQGSDGSLRRAPRRASTTTPARSSTSRTCASCSVPPSLTAEDAAALEAAMRAGHGAGVLGGARPAPAGGHRAERRPHLRRAQRPRQPARASAAPPRLRRGRRRRAAVRQPAGVRRDVGGLPPRRVPAHQRELAPHARRVRLHRARLPGARVHRRRHPRRRPSRRPSTCELRIAVGGELPGFEPWDDVLAAEDGSRHRRPDAWAPRCSTRRAPPATRRASPSRPTPTATSRRPSPCTSYRDGNVHLCTGPLYHAAPVLHRAGAAPHAAACRS